MAPRSNKSAVFAPALVYLPEADFDPQVMVSAEHSLPDTLRFAEIVYGSVIAGQTASINWSRVSRLVGMDVSECKRLWRFIAYHWKGPYGHMRSDIALEDIDPGAESDPELSGITHGTPITVKGKGKGMKKGGGGGGGSAGGRVRGGGVGVHAFTLFASEMRKQVKEANPTFTFGEIAKEFGKLWRALPDEEKAKYTERAAREKEAALAREAAKDARAAARRAAAPPPSAAARPMPAAGAAGSSVWGGAAPPAPPFAAAPEQLAS
ncbi:hypothetical protein T492DRAFT_958629 [Pavlovales sp. CCMP2436]|nr:hypothetical protein T492DRAFT_958629 [Pavlovales sp. CCMP2436]